MKHLLLGALALISLGLASAHAQSPATLNPYSLSLDTGAKTATATAGAATLAKSSGKVTTEALTTAAGATYTLTLTNSTVAAADQVYASLANGTNSTGAPGILRVQPGVGTVTITVRNGDAAAALNGTIVVSFMVVKN